MQVNIISSDNDLNLIVDHKCWACGSDMMTQEGPPRREMLKEMPKTLNVRNLFCCQSHSHCGFRTASEGEDIVYAANYFVISKEESQGNVWEEKHYKVEWHILDHTTTVELVHLLYSGSVVEVEPIFEVSSLIPYTITLEKLKTLILFS